MEHSTRAVTGRLPTATLGYPVISTADGSGDERRWPDPAKLTHSSGGVVHGVPARRVGVATSIADRNLWL
jgi:hypothetical protein